MVEYLKEMDRLEDQGEISERDHQLLRSDPWALESLVHLTSGDENAVGSETVLETLKRVQDEIREEDSRKLAEEERAHEETRSAGEAAIEALRQERAQSQRVRSKLYWRCERHANYLAGALVAVVGGTLVTLGAVAAIGLRAEASPVSWIVVVSVLVVVSGGVVNQLAGVPYAGFFSWFRDRCRRWLFRRRSDRPGIDLSDFEVG